MTRSLSPWAWLNCEDKVVNEELYHSMIHIRREVRECVETYGRVSVLVDVMVSCEGPYFG